MLVVTVSQKLVRLETLQKRTVFETTLVWHFLRRLTRLGRPHSVAKRQSLTCGGVHDRVKLGEPPEMEEVDFTDARNGGRPKCGGGRGVRSPADALAGQPDER